MCSICITIWENLTTRELKKCEIYFFLKKEQCTADHEYLKATSLRKEKKSGKDLSPLDVAAPSVSVQLFIDA